MSKRVLIIIAAGFLLIIGGIFLLKHELSNQEPPEPEYIDLPEDQEEIEPLKVVKEKKQKTENNAETVTEPGAEN